MWSRLPRVSHHIDGLVDQKYYFYYKLCPNAPHLSHYGARIITLEIQGDIQYYWSKICAMRSIWPRNLYEMGGELDKTTYDRGNTVRKSCPCHVPLFAHLSCAVILPVSNRDQLAVSQWLRH